MKRVQNATLQHRRRLRFGILKVEALVAGFILIVAMNATSTMIFRINRLWTDAAKYQFAINELSNQMEVLTRTPPEKIQQVANSISPSKECKAILGNPRLDAQVVKDEIGTRIDLRIAWLEVQPNAPSLSGWLDSRPLATEAE